MNSHSLTHACSHWESLSFLFCFETLSFFFLFYKEIWQDTENLCHFLLSVCLSFNKWLASDASVGEMAHLLWSVVSDGKQAVKGELLVLVPKIWKPLPFSQSSIWRKVQVLMVLFGCNIWSTHCTLITTSHILLSITVCPLSHSNAAARAHVHTVPLASIHLRVSVVRAAFSCHIMRK